MRRADQEALVVLLACQTNDRTPDEQRALLAVASRLDAERGAFTTTNVGHAKPPTLYPEVLDTYDPSEGRRVMPTRQQIEAHERRAAKWVPCSSCGYPAGLHVEGRHPDDEWE